MPQQLGVWLDFGSFRNHLALYTYMCEIRIPNERCLDKCQAKLFYVLHKRIKKREDGTIFHHEDFQYSIPMMFMKSIIHAKGTLWADLPVFVTQLIWSLNERTVLKGEPVKLEERTMYMTVSGVKRLWTPHSLYMRRMEDAVRGYPIQQDPFDDVRPLPYTTFAKPQEYHNASFDLSRDFV